MAIRHAISSSASFSVDRIRKKIHEPDTIIQYLRRRNQRVVWRDGLRTVFHIEIGADDDFVAVTIECGVKCRIAIIRRIKKQIEHHKARACRKEPIEQKRPDFA